MLWHSLKTTGYFTQNMYCQHSYWLTILIKNYSRENINKLINALNNKGINSCRFSAHEMKHKKNIKKFTNSHHSPGLCLPSFYSFKNKTILILLYHVKKYN